MNIEYPIKSYIFFSDKTKMPSEETFWSTQEKKKTTKKQKPLKLYAIISRFQV